MSHIAFFTTPLAGLLCVERHTLGDSRGFFSRFFCAEELRAVGFVKPVRQINHTLTAVQGTIRGMHYQRKPHAEMKMVSCLRGQVFDVAVDIRKDSPTFLQWHAEILSAENHRSLLIPEGFAHGFQALTEDCELIYLHTADYAVSSEAAVHALDPLLAIAWPLPAVGLSERDRMHPMINNTFEGVVL